MSPIKNRGASKGNGGPIILIPFDTARGSKGAHVVSLLGTFGSCPQPSLARAVQREINMEDGSNRLSPVDSGGEEKLQGNFSNRNLAVIPQEKVRPLISHIQVLALV